MVSSKIDSFDFGSLGNIKILIYFADPFDFRWAVIASSTLALRFTLLPLLIVQLNKLKRIGELFPKCKFPK